MSATTQTGCSRRCFMLELQSEVSYYSLISVESGDKFASIIWINELCKNMIGI